MNLKYSIICMDHEVTGRTLTDFKYAGICRGDAQRDASGNKVCNAWSTITFSDIGRCGIVF